MRWTCLYHSALVAANALEPVAQQQQQQLVVEPQVPVSTGHGISGKVQEALDALRQVSTTSGIKIPSRSERLLRRIRSLLFPDQHHHTKTGTTDTALSTYHDEPVRKLMEASMQEDDHDATFLMAEISMHGNFSYPRNYHDALSYYEHLAEVTGNMTAHENLALLYSTGLQGIEADQGLALAHHTFAAAQGSVRSHMALGYRHLKGIGTAPNCSAACEHYAFAADAAIQWMYDGPPGGKYFYRKAYDYSEEFGGLYGSIPTKPYPGAVTADSKDIDDVIDYYTYMAEKADAKASFALAELYSSGTRTVEQDFVKSLYWFRQVARTYWTKDGRTVKNVKAMRYHAKSAAYIATAYLRGEGTDQDFDKAKIWFQRGIALGEPIAQNGFALMHLMGLGPIARDASKAEELFKAAADNENRAAQINLGKIYAARGDIIAATRLFHSAATHGRAEAFYFLAQFFHHGIGERQDCAMATQYYKIVAESVEALHSTILAGNQAYQEGRIEDAVVANLIAAESGYETAQVNVAFLLDKKRRAFSTAELIRSTIAPQVKRLKTFLGLSTLSSSSSSSSATTTSGKTMTDELALLYYTRSAAQQNTEALIKAGDYTYYGYGTEADPVKAVSYWTTAAESRRAPLALWNLAWAYENGVGVEQDFHMAKRYYDMCLEIDNKAALPVSLSLFKLRARSAWNTMTGGAINSIRDEDYEDDDSNDGAPRKKKTKVTWHSVWTGLKHFWRSQWDTPPEYRTTDGHGGDGNNRAHDGSGSLDEEHGNFIDEDYPTAEADFYDTLFVLGVCLMVAGIVYIRTTWWQPQTRRNHLAGGGGANDRAGNAAAGVGGQGAGPLDGPNPHVAEWIVRRL